MSNRVQVVLYMKSGNQIKFTAEKVEITRHPTGGPITGISYVEAEPAVMGLNVEQIEGVTWEDIPAAGPVKVPVLCPCLCHDMNGGPVHPGKKCRCNGGKGMDK